VTTAARILDCGHTPSPHSEHTTGTAHTPEGHEICWECSNACEREHLRTVQVYGAYLVKRDGRAVIETWPGGALATVTEYWTRRVGFSHDGRTYFRAVDVHGQRWHGTSPGFGMYAWMRRVVRASRANGGS